jgi:PAS domain S-box-containing protein
LNDALRLAVDTIPGLVWTARADGSIDFLNRHWLEFTGLTFEEGADWGWRSAIHPQDVQSLETRWRSIVDSGQAGEVEARLRRADGEYRWFLVRAVPHYADDGTLTRWYGQTLDIDDRKRAEALLAAEKQLLEMVARGRPLPQILIALCRLVEDTAEGSLCSIILMDMQRKRLLQQCAPSLPVAYTEGIRNFTLTNEAGPCAMAALRNEQVIVENVENEPRWPVWGSIALASELRSCWSTPIVAHDGTVLGTFAIYSHAPSAPSSRTIAQIGRFTDLASIAIEQRRREDALRRSEVYLSEAQRLSLTGSFRWRIASGEINWSEETYRIYEIDPATPLTLATVQERVHPEDRNMFEYTRSRASHGAKDFAFEHRLLLPGDVIKYVQVLAQELRSENGELEYVGAIRDVTDRKNSEDILHRLREELAHVARVATLGELTAAIAHEINQPLAGIMTNASTCLRLLATDDPNLDGARETARRMIRDVTRAADVIARLRALFRKQSTTQEAVDLNEATREVLALMSTELTKARVVVHVELGQLPAVSGDRVQIQQVVMNLILNAVEAMSGVPERRRHLVVRSVGTEEEVRFEIEDGGVGLDPESQDQLFNAFYTSKSDGMGMGLSISRSIVERHGGRLWAVPNDRRGATFAFSLPLASMM